MVVAWHWYNAQPGSLGWVLLFGLAIAFVGKLAVIFPSGYAVDIGAAVALVAMWLHGPTIGVLAQFIGGFAGAISGRRAWLASLFAIGTVVLATLAAGLVIDPLIPVEPRLISFDEVLQGLIAFVVMMLVNSLIVTRGMSIHKGTSWAAELAGVLDAIPWYLAINFAMAWIMMEIILFVGPAGLVLAFLALAIQRYGFKLLSSASQERALDQLIRMANRPGSPRREHIQEVFRYSNALAEELGLPSHQILVVGYGALLHEIGLTPELEHRLESPARLTAEERNQIRQIGVRGAEIIGRIGALDQVAALVRHQGEAYDGSGHPDGLNGDYIPIGSQIIALADTFQALIASRPYRSAQPLKEAAKEVRSLVGSRFGPSVVDALDRVVARETWPLPGRKPTPERMEEMTGDAVEHLREYVERKHPGESFLSRGRWPWRTRLSSRLADLSPEVVALGNLIHVLNSTISLEETLRLAARTISQLVGARTLILLADREDSRFTVRAVHGFVLADLMGRRVPKSHYPAPGGDNEEAPVMIHDLRRTRSGLDQLVASAENCLCGAYISLICRGRNLGVIVVYWAEPRRYRSREMGLLSLVAGQAALAIENARLLSAAEERLEILAEMKRFTDFLLENVPAGIFVVDADGKLTLANSTARQYCRQVGWDLVPEGESYFDFAAMVGFPERSPLQRALVAGEPMTETNFPFSGPLGTIVLQIAASPLKDSRGNTLGALSMVWDVTRIRQMEDQVRRVEKMAAVGELAAGAAHEIRNPLTSVRGFIQLIQARMAGDNPEQEYFEIVINELDRIESIVRDMMVLARPAKPRLVRCDAHRLLDEVLLLGEGMFSGAGVEVSKAYCQDEGWICVDQAMIRQVLLNLIQNAVQAMPGGGRLSIFTERSDGSFTIGVADTGVGMPAEVISNLFVPFFTTKENGTGLGLSVSYGLVQAHGGKIYVESQVGAGTIFSVALPLNSEANGRSFGAGAVI